MAVHCEEALTRCAGVRQRLRGISFPRRPLLDRVIVREIPLRSITSSPRASRSTSRTPTSGNVLTVAK